MKCQWPGCQREQNAPYCYPHSRINKTSTPTKKDISQITMSELMAMAQKEFNAFIRERDKNNGCITCAGVVTDAGHYIPVGENSALRFHELNCYGQCQNCNVFKQGNLKIYRIVLIEKIGLAKVIELENYAKYHKYTRPELLSIIETYKQTKFNQTV